MVYTFPGKEASGLLFFHCLLQKTPVFPFSQSRAEPLFFTAGATQKLFGFDNGSP